MSYSNVILENEELKKHKVLSEVVKFLDGPTLIPLIEEEVVEILENATLTACCKQKINNIEDFKVKKLNDLDPTGCILLLRMGDYEFTTDTMYKFFGNIVKYKGGIEIVVSVMKDKTLAKGEFKSLFIAAHRNK